MLRLAAICLAALLLFACESQKASRDLAANAAVNTAQLAATLSQVAASERNVAKKRAKTLAAYDRAVRESKAALAFDLAITKKSGDSAAVAFLNEIQQWIVEAEREAAVENGSAVEQEQALLAQQKDIITKAEALAAIAKSLNQLAKKQGSYARAAFLKGYVEEVYSLLKASEDAAKDAESGTDTAAANIGAAAATLPEASSAVTPP
jgi:hypothetical protein